MTVYCPRCNGTNNTLIRTIGTTNYYRCEDCTAQLGRPFIFFRRLEDLASAEPAGDNSEGNASET